MKLSAVILSQTPKIKSHFLDGLSFADEILIIVDTDESKPSVKTGKVSTHYHPLNNDFSAQRNYALTLAKGDWVLFIDSDEQVSKDLGQEIRTAVETNQYSGYYLHRLDNFYGNNLKHGETGNINIVRLARSGSGKFKRPVHETWDVSGPIARLRNPLLHLRSDLASSFISRMILYGQIDADALLQEDKPFTYFRLLAFPKAKFFLNYFIKLGLLDGLLGLFHAYLMSLQSLTVRVFQWQKKNI